MAKDSQLDKEDRPLFLPEDNWDSDVFLDLNTVASSTECTGLIPSAPATDEEAESYMDIYEIPKPSPEQSTP